MTPYIVVMTKNEQRNFDIGYAHARKGLEWRADLSSYRGYDEGYDAGLSDRPSLEELTFDVMAEVNS